MTKCMFLRQLGNLCRWLMFKVPFMSIRIFSVFHPQELEALIVSNLIKPERGVIKHIAFVSQVLWLFHSLIACLNPFTAKCSQKQISTKFANFRFVKFWKTNSTMCEYRQRAFISHHGISSTDSKFRVILQNSIMYSGSERVNYRNQTSCRLYFTVCIHSLSLYSNSHCAKSVLSCTC